MAITGMGKRWLLAGWGVAQFFARAMAEAETDDYVGIVSYLSVATTLRDWSNLPRSFNQRPVLEPVNRWVDGATRTAVATGFGRWGGIMYVEAVAIGEDARRSILDMRGMFTEPNLPFAGMDIGRMILCRGRMGQGGAGGDCLAALSSDGTQLRIAVGRGATGIPKWLNARFGCQRHWLAC